MPSRNKTNRNICYVAAKAQISQSTLVSTFQDSATAKTYAAFTVLQIRKQEAKCTMLETGCTFGLAHRPATDTPIPGEIDGSHEATNVGVSFSIAIVLTSSPPSILNSEYLASRCLEPVSARVKINAALLRKLLQAKTWQVWWGLRFGQTRV